MTRRLLTLVSLLCIALFATAVDAGAAKKKTKKAAVPTVKSVAPMKAKPGEKLTITGTNLKVSKKDTRIYFLREGGGLLSAKADSASKSRVIVTVPQRIIALLRGTGENREPTRFQIRVLAGKFGSPTKLSKSPTILAPAATVTDPGAPADPGTPPDGDCDGDGVKNSVDPDDDNDALTDDLEVLPAHTNPCVADTDGDKVGDGFEYWSAKDLNVAANPYPVKLPWPNALDSNDSGVDHDGDGLSLQDEFLLWKFYGSNVVPLNYSAGLQKSVDQDASADILLAYQDMDQDGKLSDDERDADGDGIGNWDELYGRMTQDWWDAVYDGTPLPKETRYTNTFPGTVHVDPDSDGDGINDGADDQDHDGLTNAFEIERPGNWFATYVSVDLQPGGSNPWARVQPYNPCKPLWSPTCHLHWPGDYYPDDEDWDSIRTSLAGPQPTAPWTHPGATLP